MKKILISLFAASLMVGVAGAQYGAQGSAAPAQGQAQQQPQAPASQASPAQAQTPQAAPPQSPSGGASPTQTAQPTRIAPGSIIPVALIRTIDAKTVKSGDEVVAKVTQDMKTTSGEVLVPKDTKVVGHVTEAQAHNKEQKESQVGIAFDRAVMKDGNQMQMPMSIQAIIGQQNNQNNGGGGGEAAGAPTRSAAPAGGSRSGMAGAAPSSRPSGSVGDSEPSEQSEKSARPQITAQTQGVIGISNLSLNSAATNPAGASIVTSQKDNVKLESGTMLLLRVQ